MIKLKIKDTAIGWDQLFYLVVIALACFKVTYAIPKVMDILFYDESIYLYHGIHFNFDMLFKDGFIYRIWYFFLSIFVNDTVTLYYANYILLIWLNPFLFYLLLRKMKVEMFYAGLFSILFLISNVHVTAWPFITRFALVLVLGTFIFLLRAKTMKNKYLIAMTGLFLLVYTRPEYILTWVIFTITATVFLLHRYFKSKKPVLLVTTLITLLLAGFVLLVKSPANSSRSMMAFGQHYALHKYKQGEISINPNTNWKRVLKDDFNTDKSLTRALLNNPGSMASHMIANIKIIPYQIMQHLFPFATANGMIKKAILVMVVLLFFILMFPLLRQWFKQPFSWGNNRTNRDDTLFYFLAVIMMLPLLVSIVFIYPREHYLLILFAILMLIAAKNIPALPNRFYLSRLKYPIILVLFFLLPWQASSSVGLFPGKIQNIHQDQCTNLKRISFIKDLLREKIRLLSAGGSMAPYISNLQHVDEQAKQSPFNIFLEEQKINMILLNHGLINDTRFAGDKKFKLFVSSLPNKQWDKLKIPGCPGFLAIKRTIP